VCYILCNKGELLSDLLLCGFRGIRQFVVMSYPGCAMFVRNWHGIQLPYFTTSVPLIPDYPSFGGRLETVLVDS